MPLSCTCGLASNRLASVGPTALSRSMNTSRFHARVLFDTTHFSLNDIIRVLERGNMQIIVMKRRMEAMDRNRLIYVRRQKERMKIRVYIQKKKG